MSEHNENIAIFTDDDGNDVELEHLDTIKMNEKVYIVCVPVLDEDVEVEEIIILEAMKDENGGDCFLQIEDDDVLDEVCAEFKERNSDLFDFED